MRVTLAFVLASGCELDAVPAQNHAAPAPAIATAGVAAPQTFEVTVREFLTETPIAGATVYLTKWSPCRSDAQVCPPARRAIQTGEDGIMRASLPGPAWAIERIRAAGYLSECPLIHETDERHHLSDDFKKENASGTYVDHTSYLCHLVRPSALVVRDRAHAIQAAKAEREIAKWLRAHRDARATHVEVTGIRWEVRFETPARSKRDVDAALHETGEDQDYGETRLVFVDALDRSASVLGRRE